MATAEGALAQRRILVVEDEYFIADDMGRALEKLGAMIVGPVPSRDKALALLQAGESIDAAVLDISLQGETVFPVADLLIDHGVPFVFATGYDQGAVPPAYEGIPRWEKPFEPNNLAKALPALLREG